MADHRVDFYVLANTEARYPTVCRLIAKAWQQQAAVLIYAATRQEAQAVDDLLWTFRDVSFIPHTLGQTDEPAMVHIDYAATACNVPRAILINLHPEIPSQHSHFTRIFELVTPETKPVARQHYRFYQEQARTVQTHTIR